MGRREVIREERGDRGEGCTTTYPLRLARANCKCFVVVVVVILAFFVAVVVVVQ